MSRDNWKHRSKGMRCGTCMFFVVKEPTGPQPATEGDVLFGRCRKNAPTLNGWPSVFGTDWCGQHKLDENAAYAQHAAVDNDIIYGGECAKQLHDRLCKGSNPVA